ncbi:MAG: redoxin domain-containing protein [Chloroflexi bacterium]|nr:MAG: redoxin domain-containing protein [Chloroflexota bacterium]TMG72174.1 MAG: redoxin domain-containing protein [Chloroflexota bacterium]
MSALQQRFAGGKAQVVGILCDSVYTLKAWAESLGGIGYPLCSDFWPHGKVTQAYGVFNSDVGRPERAIIVVDAEGICRYIDVHQLREVPDEEEIADEVNKLGPSA